MLAKHKKVITRHRRVAIVAATPSLLDSALAGTHALHLNSEIITLIAALAGIAYANEAYHHITHKEQINDHQA